MDSLVWRQDADGLHVRVTSSNGVDASFSIDNSLINYLLAGTPRIYYVYVMMSGSQQEDTFVLDLTTLRPVIQKSNGLRIVSGRKQRTVLSNSGSPVGRCCIARGESYHDRYLAAAGWQIQRVYQDMYGADSKVVAQTVIEEAPAAVEPAVEELTSAPISEPKIIKPQADEEVDLDLTL